MTTIGKQKRKFINEFKLMLPGVGLYNVEQAQMRKTRGGSFNKATRSITEISATSFNRTKGQGIFSRPGPGSYSLQLRKNQKLTSFPLSRRFITEKQTSCPGPGDYRSQQSSKDKIKSGAICRSARTTFNIKGGKMPAPTDYSVPQISFYKKKQPTALFGKAKRILHSNEGESDLLKRCNTSKQKQQDQQVYRRTQVSQRMNLKMQRAWHGKKIEKQAKRVQKDQIDISN